VLRRPALVVLAGDVGSGKSELAETIGDAVARQEKIDIALFPMSLSTRGQGRVGEMTQLLSAAFDYTIAEASRLKGSSGRAHGAVILLVDEADALAQSRETVQMHHEDRAGVNAFIRGIDRVGNGRLPAAVIMCTNRLGALDPAVKRRAADILAFGRPDEGQRHAVLGEPLKQLGFSKPQIDAIVAATGVQKSCAYGFTFSDLTQRLLPAIVLDAYPKNAVKSGACSGDRARDDPDATLSGRCRMTDWSLSVLLAGLHDEIERKLEIVRKSFGHSGTKGDASEKVWLELLQTYLPRRYQAAKAHVVDSKGVFSDQIDVVIFDRQYSPFIFQYEDQTIIPAESVYGAFEAKQSINAGQVAYAQKKVASVRRFHRTSLPIPHAGGMYKPKALTPILSGILSFESDWNPAFGEPLGAALDGGGADGCIDLGCIAAHGYFSLNQQTKAYETFPAGKPAISQLQFSGTVPMIDVQAYAEWLSK
jgi:hypothetical protein